MNTLLLRDLEAFDEQMHCSFFLKKGMFRVDMKGAYSENELESIREGMDSIFNDIKIKVDSPVNLIINKLLFGTDQDYEDAIAVYVRNEESINNNDISDKARRNGIFDLTSTFLQKIDEYKNAL